MREVSAYGSGCGCSFPGVAGRFNGICPAQAFTRTAELDDLHKISGSRQSIPYALHSSPAGPLSFLTPSAVKSSRLRRAHVLTAVYIIPSIVFAMRDESLKVDTFACCEGTGGEAELRDGRPLAEMARVFKALSDPTRLRLFRTIISAGRPVCECDVVPGLGVSQPTVSYHLKILRQAGLLEVERRGVWAYYRASPGALLRVVHYLTAISS